MLIKQIHKLINLGVQKIHSNQYDNFLPDELDEIFNLCQVEFLKDAYNGTRSNNIAREDIKELVRTHKLLTAVYPKERWGTPDSYKHFPNAAYVTLPVDYMYHLSSMAHVDYIEDSVCDNECITRNENGVVEYIATLPYQAVADGECVNFSNLFLLITLLNALGPGQQRSNIPIFDIRDFADKFKGLKEDNDKYVIVQTVLEYLNRFNTQSEVYRTGGSFNPSFNNSFQDGFDLEYDNAQSWFEVYWESYKELYIANNFIFVTKNMEDILSEEGDVIRQEEVGGTGYVNATGIDIIDYQNSQVLATGNITTGGGRVQSVTNLNTVADLTNNYCTTKIVLITTGNEDAYAVANIEAGQVISVIPLSLVDERHPEFVSNWNASGLGGSDYWGVAIRLQTLPTSLLPVPGNLEDPLNSEYIKEFRFKAIGYDTAKFCCATNPIAISSKVSDMFMIAPQDISWMLQHPSRKPSPKRPLSVLRNNEMWVYSDGTFFVKEVYLDYVKAPRPINHKLGITSEFNLAATYKIIERCVEYILRASNNPGYQAATDRIQRRSE